MSEVSEPRARPEPVLPGVWRIPVPVRTLPPFDHTNAYVIGQRGVALVVDPGGDAPSALAAIAEAVRLAGATSPKAIVLTHTHGDHRGGVDALRGRWPDAEVFAHPSEAGTLSADWRVKGLAGGRRLVVADEVVEAVHTPGHSPGHIALWLERPRALLAGDLVAGRGSVWVGLPAGDVAAYLESLARAAALDPEVVAPGHGPVRRDGAAVLHEARAHRLEREAAVISTLRGAPLVLDEIRSAIYPTLAPAVVDLADRSLLAHLRKLMAERRVMHVGDDQRGPYMLTPGAATTGAGAPD